MPTELTASALDQHQLQYVSLEIDGQTYGGWYRVLDDGRMELLALATMHSEQRAEGTPLEQAKGMLTDFIRSSNRRQKDVLSVRGARH